MPKFGEGLVIRNCQHSLVILFLPNNCIKIIKLFKIFFFHSRTMNINVKAVVNISQVSSVTGLYWLVKSKKKAKFAVGF